MTFCISVLLFSCPPLLLSSWHCVSAFCFFLLFTLSSRSHLPDFLSYYFSDAFMSSGAPVLLCLFLPTFTFSSLLFSCLSLFLYKFLPLLIFSSLFVPFYNFTVFLFLLIFPSFLLLSYFFVIYFPLFFSFIVNMLTSFFGKGICGIHWVFYSQ